MVNPPSNKIVWITWLDAENSSSRMHADELREIKLSRNTNLGWIVHESATLYVLAHGYGTSGEVDYFAIPKNAVESIVPVTQDGKTQCESEL